MKDLHQHVHDIRRPLNSISMQAELIKMLAENEDALKTQAASNEITPKIEAAANKIIQNSKAVSELLQVLFDDVSRQMQAPPSQDSSQ